MVVVEPSWVGKGPKQWQTAAPGRKGPEVGKGEKDVANLKRFTSRAGAAKPLTKNPKDGGVDHVA